MKLTNEINKVQRTQIEDNSLDSTKFNEFIAEINKLENENLNLKNDLKKEKETTKEIQNNLN